MRLVASGRVHSIADSPNHKREEHVKRSYFKSEVRIPGDSAEHNRGKPEFSESYSDVLSYYRLE